MFLTYFHNFQNYPSIYQISMATEQTPSTQEDREMWLKYQVKRYKVDLESKCLFLMSRINFL